LFKISAFPFQSWVFDVYDGAPSPITAYMASTFKIAVFSFFLRIFIRDLDLIANIWDDL